MRATFDTSNRKDLVAAIAEVTGLEKKYLGVPKCNYQVGPFIIDKACELTCEDSNAALLQETIAKLEDKGFHGMIEDLPEEEELEEQEETEEAVKVAISVPAECVDLDNLNSLLEAKGELIKKALGATELPIKEEDGKISFPWFLDIAPETLTTYTKFISKICEMTVKQKRISSKPRKNENEKYTFRCFLLRLGFIGDEFKADRKILLSKLSGSSAFKSGSKKGGEEA